jgi:glycerophosphoryl diester phosphodiesterase
VSEFKVFDQSVQESACFGGRPVDDRENSIVEILTKTIQVRTMMNSLAKFAFLAVLCLMPEDLKAAEPPQPLIVAHRGVLRHAPENTLANFRACLESQLGFEFDVQRTKDGDLICIHDNTVDRTTNGSGNVAEMTFDQIRRLDAGSWFNPKFAGEKVPTIEEVLQLVAEYRQFNVLIAVDLKAENVEQDVVQIAEKHGVLNRLLFIGRTISEPIVREQLRSASPNAHAAAVANNPEEFPTALAAPNADWVYFRYLPTKEQIEAVHSADKRAFIAGPTVAGDLPENWGQATDAGINAILTDYPLELRERFRLMPSK